MEVGLTPPEVVPLDPRVDLKPVVSMPRGFRFNEVPSELGHPRLPDPPLGPLAAFTGTWGGNGFNTIFRPNSPDTPTPLTTPVQGAVNNVLELNLTKETLSFSAPLGLVPDRGAVTADAKLNGVPYAQSVEDVTTGDPIGIHFEPGLWMIVPATTDPEEGVTLVRMGSIPHGTTINGQGTFKTFDRPPTFPSMDVTPFKATPVSGIQPAPQLSMKAHNPNTARIPQDLTPFLAAGTITAEMIANPATVLQNAIANQNIVHTTEIDISSAPYAPLFGGGIENIAFLWGNSGNTSAAYPRGQNAQTLGMGATFWIERVAHTVILPPVEAPGETITLRPEGILPGQPAPTFSVRPPVTTHESRQVEVFSTQIQYAQSVTLAFDNLFWPHVSVATLVPVKPLELRLEDLDPGLRHDA
jgi:hypothetical protein